MRKFGRQRHWNPKNAEKGKKQRELVNNYIVPNNIELEAMDMDYSMFEQRIFSRYTLSGAFGLTDKQFNIAKCQMTSYIEGVTTEEEIINFFMNNKGLFKNNQEFYTDTDTCKRCQGKCCKKTSCTISPEDIGDITYDTIKELLESNFASIDWNESNEEKKFFLRVREVGKDKLDPSYGGVCSMLTETGCKLPWEKRPKGGRLLRVTYMTGHCISDYKKEDCANEWAQYSQILQKLADEYSNGKSLDDIEYENKPKEFDFSFL